MVLTLVVAPYVLLVGAASLGFTAARRADSTPPSDWPTVSILVDRPSNSPDDLPHSILESSYPDSRRERIEEIIRLRPDAPDDLPHSEEASVRVRSVQVGDSASGETLLGARLRQGLETASGEVLLATTAECEVPPNWIQSMMRRCTPTTPIVVGPTLLEHDDLFLPRLEAFQRVGAFAFAAGLQHLGLRLPYPASNLAIRAVDGTDLSEDGDAALPYNPRNGRAVFNPETQAAVRCSPAPSFLEYLRRQARTAQSVVRQASWSLQTALLGLWLTHAVLLVCCLVAVALPAWRQPTLLALLGKMGADALLSVPAARHFGQRTLTRSLVPGELLLVLSTPVAGILAFFEFFLLIDL